MTVMEVQKGMEDDWRALLDDSDEEEGDEEDEEEHCHGLVHAQLAHGPRADKVGESSMPSSSIA